MDNMILLQITPNIGTFFFMLPAIRFGSPFMIMADVTNVFAGTKTRSDVPGVNVPPACSFMTPANGSPSLSTITLFFLTSGAVAVITSRSAPPPPPGINIFHMAAPFLA